MKANAMGGRLLAGLLACCAVASAQGATGGAPDRVLEGRIEGRDHQTYRSLPFEVPAGTSRITVEFEYSGRERKTTVDLGLSGPDGFRGWSGGNKRRFTVSATDATPSYLPGPIVAGRWSLLLGFPNVRESSRDSYVARIWFDDHDGPAPPLRSGAAWYRGDLHMHDAHSDGSCASQSGQRVPCPLFLTVQKAAARGLDFISVTDHNTVSQANGLREMQPYFDRLLLIPGREITTFSGHGNLIGPVAPVDFRVGSQGVPDWNHLLRGVRNLEGVFSINHPVRPSGEVCMGCGWAPDPQVDYALVQAVEVVNGGDAGTPYSGIPFWEGLLNAGHRITAIGGSDNHDPALQAATPGSGEIGAPTTVVKADALSMPAILAGIRAGRVFVDVQGNGKRMLEFSAASAGRQVGMGEALRPAAGSEVAYEVGLHGVAGGQVEVIEDGKIVQTLPLDAARDTQIIRFSRSADGRRHWLRVNVRGGDGRLWLVGNPVYLE
ncbi:MAG TPA: CehA/McbA family metallohydrolase [Pseudoxanthomonas sp.]|nr:CehA/McbA family metallohydrolase [Pseudoxanthomonas sp.]